MRVCAFDVSFRTGWAVLEHCPHATYGARVVGAGVIHRDRTSKIRLDYIRSAILASDYVGMEDVFATKGSQYMIEVSKRIGEIRALCYVLGKEYVEIHPSTMRSFVQKGKGFWLRCKNCKSLVYSFRSQVKMNAALVEYKDGCYICPECKKLFVPLVVTEGKEPVISFANQVEPFLGCKADDSDAIVLALIAGHYFNVFPNERLESWRTIVLERLKGRPKSPIKRMRRKKKKKRKLLEE